MATVPPMRTRAQAGDGNGAAGTPRVPFRDADFQDLPVERAWAAAPQGSRPVPWRRREPVPWQGFRAPA
jgi:hypothetical protein